jgi:hypothetical protein
MPAPIDKVAKKEIKADWKTGLLATRTSIKKDKKGVDAKRSINRDIICMSLF